ncbi:MAG: NUDIX hydrolase [Dehalococcoidia bacterium]
MKPQQVFVAYDGVGAPEEANYCLVCGSSLVDSQHGGRMRRGCESCGYIRYRNVAGGVSMLVVEDRRVLLCRRRANVFQGGKWCLPCGYIEYDEDFLTAAMRETEEETGLRVEVVSILSVCSNFLSPDVHTLVAVLLARKTGGEERPGNDEIDALRWCSPDEPLPPMAFASDEHIIARYFATRFEGAPVQKMS